MHTHQYSSSTSRYVPYRNTQQMYTYLGIDGLFFCSIVFNNKKKKNGNIKITITGELTKYNYDLNSI